MKDHDCDSCEKSGAGECDLEPVLRACRNAYTSGGAPGLGALCALHVAQPSDFYQYARTALSVMGGCPSDIEAFRLAMLSAVPDGIPALTQGIKIILIRLFHEILQTSFTDMVSEINLIGDAMGMDFKVGSSVMVIPKDSKASSGVGHTVGTKTFADFPEPNAGVFH